MAEQDFSDWFVEFSDGLNRSIPPLMVQLKDLERTTDEAKNGGDDGDVDLFSTIYRYQGEDPHIGPVIGGLVFDLDDAKNPERARKEAIELVRYLKNELGVKEESIDICFSGSKGFSLAINRRVFEFEPSELLPLVHKSMAKEIVEKLDLGTADLVIYERRRLWRLPNTRNSKSMLYKIRITSRDLENLSIDEIRRLASRPSAIIQKGDHRLSEQALAFYEKHKASVEEDLSKKREAFAPADLKGVPIPCIKDLVEKGVEEGRRNAATFALAVFFARSGENIEAITTRLLPWNRLNRPPELDDRVERTIESAFRGVLADRYDVGCRTQVLAEHCDAANCPLFASKPQPLTPDVEAFLRSPDLHEKTIHVLDYRIAGERELKGLIHYNSLGAAIHEKPSGLIIVDRYAAGKSHAGRETLSYGFPSERVEQPTSVTTKAVNYLVENYRGKIVRIDEITGMEEGMPLIRVWMTEGRLEAWIAPTSEDKVKETQKRVVEGCPAFITTSTKTPDPEFGRRNWIGHCDLSLEQTKQIHAMQSKRDKWPKMYFKEQDDELDLYRKAVKYVMDNARPVLVPFEFSFPAEQVRSRGDRAKFSQLVKDVCLWRMLQRGRFVDADGTEYLIAQEEDFNTAKEVAGPFLRATLLGLDQTSLAVLDYVRKNWGDGTLPVITYASIKIKKEGGGFLSYDTIVNKCKSLESENFVTINKDAKPHEVSPISTELPDMTDSIKIIDDGSATMEEYRKIGKIIEPEEGTDRNA